MLQRQETEMILVSHTVLRPARNARIPVLETRHDGPSVVVAIFNAFVQETYRAGLRMLR